VLQAALDALRREGLARLAEDGFPPERSQVEMSARARYVGQSSELPVPIAHPGAAQFLAVLAEAFAKEHERNYGFRAPPGEPVEIMGLAVIARGVPLNPRLPPRIPPVAAVVPQARRAWFAEAGWVETPVVDRARLAAGARQGPLIVQEYDATTLVPAAVKAAVDAFGNIVMSL